MIISCDQCHKKFEIDSNLIPKDGRLLECGSCNHKWFYKQDIKDKAEEIIVDPKLKNIEEENIDPILANISKLNELDILSKKKDIIENKKIKKIGVLNIIIVFVISFVALIILVETFKKPISIYIPNIEFILNSMHEILRDIILFFKDLIK